jgi:hypothetical protein
MGQKGKVHLVPAGLSERGSYEFRQDKNVTYKEYGTKYKATTVFRDVTITGSGESATGAGITEVTKKQGS